MGKIPFGRWHRDPRLLGLLLACSVALAGALAVRTSQSIQAQRRAAERDLREEVEFAAFMLASHAGRDVYWGLVDLFAPVVPHDQIVRGGPGVPLDAVIADPCEYEFTCAIKTQARAWFRLQSHSARVEYVVPGGEVVLEDRARTADSVLARLRTARPRPALPFVQIVDRRPDGLVAVVAVVSTDSLGREAAYGFTIEARAYGSALMYRSTGGRRPLLPASLHARPPAESLYVVRLMDRAGRVLSGAVAEREPVGALGPTGYRARLPVDSSGRDLVAEVTLRPRYVVSRLAAVTPSSGLITVVVVFLLNAVVVVMVAIQLRRALVEARHRTDFTAGVSHELRTPLTQILLYGESLRDGSLRVERDRRHASEVIVREARRLLVLIENVLRFSRADRRDDRLAPLASRPMSLTAEVTSTVAEFAPLAAARKTRLVTDLEESLSVLAEPAAVRQLLTNLLDNAVKYGPCGQTVAVGCRGREGLVLLWVDDEGPGVAEGDRERVWEPFVRLERERLPGGATGTGLGLAVVRQLVQAMEARAWVEDRPGGGARFVVEFAVAEAHRSTA